MLATMINDAQIPDARFSVIIYPKRPNFDKSCT